MHLGSELQQPKHHLYGWNQPRGNGRGGGVGLLGLRQRFHFHLLPRLCPLHHPRHLLRHPRGLYRRRGLHRYPHHAYHTAVRTHHRGRRHPRGLRHCELARYTVHPLVRHGLVRFLPLRVRLLGHPAPHRLSLLYHRHLCHCLRHLLLARDDVYIVADTLFLASTGAYSPLGGGMRLDHTAAPDAELLHLYRHPCDGLRLAAVDGHHALCFGAHHLVFRQCLCLRQHRDTSPHHQPGHHHRHHRHRLRLAHLAR